MKKDSTRIISLICAIALILTSCIISYAQSGNLNTAPKYRNAYERILAEEGFVYGVNLPWFGQSSTKTQTFGDNAFKPTVSAYDHAWAEVALSNIKKIGFTAVRTWIFTGWNGIELDSNGYAKGLTDVFVKNITDYLELAKKIGITVNPVIVPHFYQSSDDIVVASQIIVNPAATESFVKNALNPLLDIMKNYEDNIVGIDLYCEPEADTQIKARVTEGTTMEKLKDFISAEAAAVKAKLPNIPRLVSAGQNHVVSDYNDIDLTIMGVDTYNDKAEVESISDMNTVYPMWITECGAKTDHDTTEMFNTNSVLSFYSNAKEAGYKACFYWHYTGGVDLSLTKGVDPSNLRLSATSIHFAILDNLYERNHIDTSSYADKPVILNNTSSDVLKWIATRDALSYKLEMKVNGGKWQTVEEALDPDEIDANSVCSYTFEEFKETGVFTFRVTATTFDGLVAVSDEYSCNVTGLSSVTCSPEQNLVVNYGFEDGFINDASGNPTKQPKGWKHNFTEKNAWEEGLVVETGNVKNGSSAMHIYGAKGPQTGKVLFQEVDVKPNTNYTYTFFMKVSEYASPASLFSVLLLPNSTSWVGNVQAFQKSYSYPAENEEPRWRMYTNTFNSGSYSKVCLYFYVGGTEMWLDDVYFFETDKK